MDEENHGLSDNIIRDDILDEVSWRFAKGERLFTITIDPRPEED